MGDDDKLTVMLFLVAFALAGLLWMALDLRDRVTRLEAAVVEARSAR